MARSILDQVWKGQIAEENQRRRVKAKESGKKFKPVEVDKFPKSQVRSGPAALCQNHDYLRFVKEYDYDLSSVEFQQYCRERGVLHVAGKTGSPRWQSHAEHQGSREAFLRDPNHQHAQKFEGQQLRYSDEQMETAWRIVELSRARFQDCWELFTAAAT